MGFQVSGMGSANRDQEDNERGNLPELGKLELVVSRLRYYTKDTGFFVLEGVPAGKLPPLPEGYESFSNNLQGQVCVKGSSKLFEKSDQAGNTLACHGKWVIDPSYGLQFESVFLQDVIPSNPVGLLRYLSRGYLKGIGPSTAAQMVTKHGMDVLRILEEEPGVLTEIPGMTSAKVQHIASQWLERKKDFEILAFFGQYEIGEALTRKIRDQMGDENLMMRVRDNPYIITEVDGVGFKTADRMAKNLGVSVDHPMRMQSALDQVLKDRIQEGGHTAVPFMEWLDLSAQYISQSPELLKEHARSLISAGRVVSRPLRMIVNDDGHAVETDVSCVTPAALAHSERILAEWLNANRDHHKIPSSKILLRRMDTLSRLRDPASTLDPSQQVAAWMALKSPSSVMTGGPGTGKTTTIRAITSILEAQGVSMRLAAPTGRAAKRMEEAVGREASTIHRSLQYIPISGFQKNESDPLTEEYIIVDEGSMIDQFLGAALARAISPQAQLLLVGDVDQLPSVGAGDVLRNIIDSNTIPVTRLQTVHRQAKGSAIAYNAQKVLQGKAPDFDGNPNVEDFAFISALDNEAILQGIEQMTKLALAQGFKTNDIQILSPQNTGALGTDVLNTRLRPLLNPNAAPSPEGALRDWRVGDRLMQTKNNYDKNVFNGDMGIVLDLKPDGAVKLELEDGREVELSRKESYDLKVGFAITVHKSQGGERPVIIIPIVPGHTHMLTRNLLYTGITRGKSKVFLVGNKRTAMLAIQHKETVVRLTGLRQEIAKAWDPQPALRNSPSWK